ncbi:MAG: SGNH/GDSL hydrolase family protein [Acidobacteria bacterium]|nr:SGNH/GDSL hydrolase family protein [Acidobacteriota bacterium]MBI3425805.1 SGNH/GDSL hydrolase family protein [Acidobacteriota bacterium]
MAKHSQTKPVKALFIGNSFTGRNDVPGLIAQLAAARGQQFEHRLIQAGGASLRMHWNKGAAQNEIQQARYDYVVLQEQSTLPVKNPSRMHENIRLFDQVIKDSGAKTALYLTWARQNAPGMQAAITAAYTTIGEELRATIIPVGTAWQSFLRDQAQPVLHDKDQSHPTLAGSYLAACVFFAILFSQAPVGIASELKGLTPAEIELLQATAWAAVKQ